MSETRLGDYSVKRYSRDELIEEIKKAYPTNSPFDCIAIGTTVTIHEGDQEKQVQTFTFTKVLGE